MYHEIVRARVRSTFEKINRGDYMTMVQSLAPTFEYRFHGMHALGGRRTTTESVIRWWERTLRVLPGARFDIQDILVNGGPQRTRVAVRSLVSGDLPDGARYRNTVFQFMTLRWGRIVSVETLEDLQILQAALRAVHEAGDPEAVAEPITD